MQKIDEARGRAAVTRRTKFCRCAFWIFAVPLVASLFAEFIANDRPIAIEYHDSYYFPVFRTYSDHLFGGTFDVAADYRDPYLQKLIKDKGGVMLWPPIRFSYKTQVSTPPSPFPSKPTWLLTEQDCQYAATHGFAKCSDLEFNWLGTDDQGRDVVARLIYGLRFGVLIGILASLAWLVMIALARSLFRGRWAPMFDGGIVTLPSVFGASVFMLVTLDYQGFGVSPAWPSLGEMLRQAHDNPRAWWLWIAAGAGLAVLLGFTLAARCALRAARLQASP
jgi:microcin C transport system permease protein